jgi:hypothetical protein
MQEIVSALYGESKLNLFSMYKDGPSERKDKFI